MGPSRSDFKSKWTQGSSVDAIGLTSCDTTLFYGQRRNDSPGKELEKRTLFASQTEDASESLRYLESEKSTSEDIHG